MKDLVGFNKDQVGMKKVKFFGLKQKLKKVTSSNSTSSNSTSSNRNSSNSKRPTKKIRKSKKKVEILLSGPGSPYLKNLIEEAFDKPLNVTPHHLNLFHQNSGEYKPVNEGDVKGFTRLGNSQVFTLDELKEGGKYSFIPKFIILLKEPFERALRATNDLDPKFYKPINSVNLAKTDVNEKAVIQLMFILATLENIGTTKNIEKKKRFYLTLIEKFKEEIKPVINGIKNKNKNIKKNNGGIGSNTPTPNNRKTHKDNRKPHTRKTRKYVGAIASLATAFLLYLPLMVTLHSTPVTELEVTDQGIQLSIKAWCEVRESKPINADNCIYEQVLALSETRNMSDVEVDRFYSLASGRGDPDILLHDEYTRRQSPGSFHSAESGINDGVKHNDDVLKDKPPSNVNEVTNHTISANNTLQLPEDDKFMPLIAKISEGNGPYAFIANLFINEKDAYKDRIRDKINQIIEAKHFESLKGEPFLDFLTSLIGEMPDTKIGYIAWANDYFAGPYPTDLDLQNELKESFGAKWMEEDWKPAGRFSGLRQIAYDDELAGKLYELGFKTTEGGTAWKTWMNDYVSKRNALLYGILKNLTPKPRTVLLRCLGVLQTDLLRNADKDLDKIVEAFVDIVRIMINEYNDMVFHIEVAGRTSISVIEFLKPENMRTTFANMQLFYSTMQTVLQLSNVE